MCCVEIRKRGFHGHQSNLMCEDKSRVGFRLFYYIRDSKHDWRDPIKVYIGMIKNPTNFLI